MHRWLMGTAVVLALAAALALLTAGGQDSLAASGIIYVDVDAPGPTHDGSTWDYAFTDLQLALDAAVAPAQIWVAAGTYLPAAQHGGTGDRYRSFQMVIGVAIYGGFDPSAGDIAWEDRDCEANATILSGDLNGDDGPDFANNDENSYHVFYHPDSTGLDGTAILDGFTITGGNADGDFPHHDRGGGMFNYSSSPALINCAFAGNSAASGGGGMYNAALPSPALTNCTFTGNSASDWGGGMYNSGGSSPVLTNCILWGNTGDEIVNVFSTPVVTYSDIQGSYEGEGNIDDDPLFVDAAGGDVHLQPGSPCIDVGNDAAPNLPDHDFEGDPRIIDGDGDIRR